MREPTTIELDGRDLLVVAGLPGAGKTTMLRHAAGELPVLDSDQVRLRLREVLPASVAYRWYRPLVHAGHRARVVGRAASAGGPVVVHEPATRASTRALLAALGKVTGRRVRMLWLDATADEALAGQRDRGRLIRERSFARHVRRAAKTRAALLSGSVPRGWHSARVITRSAATATRLVERAPAVHKGRPGVRNGRRPA
ncbi:AAA family ATPase [Amycolatopsis sp. NPDC059021]|uniref:AAA family ATPase n=1 Tax=Amycolatopsis sp. NPDC059021 TaxID=3346704 RepID=UPI00366E3F9E